MSAFVTNSSHWDKDYMRKNRRWSHVGTTGEGPKLWATTIADDRSLIWNSVLLDDFSECTGEVRKIEDTTLCRALKSKKEREARRILGAAETPAQRAKKAADKTKKEKTKAKKLQADDSGADNSSALAAAQRPAPIPKCPGSDGCKVVGCKLAHRRKCWDYSRCKDRSCKFAHKASDRLNKSNNLPVITAATATAESKPSGTDFVSHNSPSYSSQYICYPTKEGEWKNFKLTVCPKCLCNTASEPGHNRATCSNDMSPDVHLPCPDRYKATMSPTYRIGAIAAAMAVEPAKRAATYLRKNKNATRLVFTSLLLLSLEI